MVWEPKHGCCCCASTRTGTLILGWLGVILAVLGLLGSIRMAVLPKEALIERCRAYEEMFGSEDDPDGDCYDGSIGGIVSSIVEELIQGGISVLLILGVNKRNPCLMIPYMIMQVFAIIVCGLLSVALLILLLVYHNWLGAFLVLLIPGGFTFLLTYFFLVVRVCYKEVKAQQVTGGNDIEVGIMETQEPSPHPFKSVLEAQHSAPPPYSKLESQNSAPPSYSKIGFE